MIRKIHPDKTAAEGTVMIHAAMIEVKYVRRTSFFGFGFVPNAAFMRRRVSHSRKKPTPNTEPTAICVELTGRPSQLATITVSAADSATQ